MSEEVVFRLCLKRMLAAADPEDPEEPLGGGVWRGLAAGVVEGLVETPEGTAFGVGESVELKSAAGESAMVGSSCPSEQGKWITGGGAGPKLNAGDVLGRRLG